MNQKQKFKITEQLGKAIERAKMGEDRRPAARIRDLGKDWFEHCMAF